MMLSFHEQIQKRKFILNFFQNFWGRQGPFSPQVALPLGGKVIQISYTKGVWEEGWGGGVGGQLPHT